VKLAFSSNAFRKFSIERVIALLKKIGYDGLELMCDRPHAWPPDLDAPKLRSIRAALKKHRMPVSNLNAFMMCVVGDFHHPSWIEPDLAYRRQRVDHTIACLELAAKLGARTVSTEPGGPIPKGWSRKRAYREFRDELRGPARRAEELGVRLLIEPEPELLIEKSDQFLDFIESVESPSIGLNFDMGHFHCVGEKIPDLIRRFGRRIAHAHLEDIKNRKHHHLEPGKGDIDFAAVFEAFREIGYDGWVTIELYPYQDNPEEVARRSHETIRPLVDSGRAA
jgi:sugar phosphate isomerase/epimerase